MYKYREDPSGVYTLCVCSDCRGFRVGEEGNMIEIYWPTGLAYGQPYGHPLDLGPPEEDLLRDIETLATRLGIAWSPGANAQASRQDMQA